MFSHLLFMEYCSVIFRCSIIASFVIVTYSCLLGAIWDSVVDINETAVGVPAAVFPNNALLRNACTKYILYVYKYLCKSGIYLE